MKDVPPEILEVSPSRTAVHNPWPSRSISVASHSTFKIFSSPFDVAYTEVPLQSETELIDLQFPEVSKPKFLACHILDFYKNHISIWMIPLRSILGTTLNCIWFWGSTSKEYGVVLQFYYSQVHSEPKW